jgi:hypothetical protein
MISPETCIVEYLGFEKPKNPDELKIEIAGLEHLIAKAGEKIAALKQSLILAEIIIAEEARVGKK